MGDAKMGRIQIPFGKSATPLNLDYSEDDRLGPFVIVRDTNGSPILSLSITWNGYVVAVADGVDISPAKVTI